MVVPSFFVLNCLREHGIFLLLDIRVLHNFSLSHDILIEVFGLDLVPPLATLIPLCFSHLLAVVSFLGLVVVAVVLRVVVLLVDGS